MTVISINIFGAVA